MDDSISTVRNKLSSIGHVRYDGALGEGEWSDVHRFIVTSSPISNLSEIKDQEKYVMYAWFEGEEVDVDEARAAFELAGSYTSGGRVGSGPYGGYDFLKRPDNG